MLGLVGRQADDTFRDGHVDRVGGRRNGFDTALEELDVGSRYTFCLLGRYCGNSFPVFWFARGALNVVDLLLRGSTVMAAYWTCSPQPQARPGFVIEPGWDRGVFRRRHQYPYTSVRSYGEDENERQSLSRLGS